MARELDEDPERLILQCLEFLAYAQAKAGLESKDEGTRKACRKANPVMFERWLRNEYDLKHESLTKREGWVHPPGDCKPCKRLGLLWQR